MKLKVCGMKYQKNIEELLILQPDFMGFIFYPGSPRFVFQELNSEFIQSITTTKKVGVFVNEKINTILNIVDKYNLDYVQLHGFESPKDCEELAKKIKVIKAFKCDEQIKKIDLSNFSSCTYLLFDSPGKNYGGNGIPFSYDLLNELKIESPFFLSGGLHHSQFSRLPNHPLLVGIDVNSQYETSPGIKNIEELKKLKTKIYELDTIRN